MMMTNTRRMMMSIVVLSLCVLGCQAERKEDSYEMVYEGEDSQSRWCPADFTLAGYYDEFCLTSGKVTVRSTWANFDRAYELTAKKTILSTPWIYRPREFRLHFLAKREGNAKLKIYFDYLEENYLVENDPIEPAPINYDGLYPTYRESVEVDINDWEQFEFARQTPPWADRIGIHIVKQGAGSITLMHLHLDGALTSFPDKDYQNLGESCADDNECGDAFCTEGRPLHGDGKTTMVCSECKTDKHCDASSICGSNGVQRYCVYPGVKPLGELCAVDDECRDSICCEGRCSLCCDDDDCDDGKCLVVNNGDPFQCQPGEGTYLINDVCFRGSDCASGYCRGRLPNGEFYDHCLENQPKDEECLLDTAIYGQCTEPVDL